MGQKAFTIMELKIPEVSEHQKLLNKFFFTHGYEY